MKKERARERARNRSTRGIAQGAAAAAKKTQDGSGAATTTTITDGLPPPRPRASLRAAPEARAVGVGWWTSCVLVTLLGLPPFFSMFKCALDPWFSDILRPGPGSALLGDSGRMLMYEMRGDGLLSKLIGGPAWALGALMLGTGSLSVCLCWLGTARPQKITAYVTIVEGSLYILGAVYWTVTGVRACQPSGEPGETGLQLYMILFFGDSEIITRGACAGCRIGAPPGAAWSCDQCGVLLAVLQLLRAR
eukprot:COSAG01_NODE_3299_length_6296_cov_243.565112_6_plen_249_part_00